MIGVMPITRASRERRLPRRGTVWLAFDDEDSKYSGNWDLEPDGPPTLLEDCPRSASAHEVIAWAWAWARRVYIRPRHDSGRYYSVGADTSLISDECPAYEADH